MASAALVVSRREESKTGLSLKNGPREVGFPQDPENPPISRSHIPFKIVARAPPRVVGLVGLAMPKVVSGFNLGHIDSLGHNGVQLKVIKCLRVVPSSTFAA